MVDEFGEKLMHNKERNLRKDGLNMMAFDQLKFVNVYTFVNVYKHGPSSSHYLLCFFVLVTTVSTHTLSAEKEVKRSFKS